MNRRSVGYLKIIALVSSLIMIQADPLRAQASDVSMGVEYSWRPTGQMPPDYRPPTGLDSFRPDSLAPLSLSYPVKVPGLQLLHESSADGSLFIQYEVYNDNVLRMPLVVDFSDYYLMQLKTVKDELWKEKVTKTLYTEDTKGKESSIELIGADIAGQRVSLRVMGNITITGRLNNQTQATQITNYNQANTSNFILDQTQNFNIEGRIGDRLSIKVDQDSERDFNFENTLKIFYTGNEDEIVQRVDAGNIDLSLPGTTLITGKANTSGLFGIKALLKFGPLDITTIASVEEGQNQRMTWGGGSESEPLLIKDYQYVRNKYFFINDEFRRNMYPLNELGQFVVRRQVREFELYKNVLETEAGAFSATAWIDPNDTTYYADKAERNLFFKRLERDVDYVLNEQLGYFKLQGYINAGDVLAVAYRDSSLVPGDLLSSLQEGDLYGLDSTIKDLKLIKPYNPQPNHPTWNLEFKNVYSLGTTNINPDGFELKIYNNAVAPAIDRDGDGVSWLRHFGLDNQTEAGTSGHDEIIDNNPALLRMTDGELWIPYVRPFTSESGREANPETFDGLYNPDLPEELSSFFLYDTSSTTAITTDSKFYIEVKYSNRSSEIQLKDFMIIEGSEEISAGGVPLTRGIDYTIDYFSGRITLISETALNPTAELSISYNARQLFQLDKKTVAGIRMEYSFGKSNFLGGTFMYYSQSSIDEQVRVGEEPFRNMIWDINGKIGYQMDWLTRAINALPLIETSDPSSFNVAGEIAQILPNPNTINNPDTGDPNGVANIDDFEGAKQTTPMGVEKNGWYPASRPQNENIYYGEQGYLFWYNIWGDVPTSQIWPEKETSSTMNNDVTRVLSMVLDPMMSGITGNATETGEKREVWNGVMRPLYTGAWDQSESKFIEVWARGEKGKLRLDLGVISEDLDLFDTTTMTIKANRRLDTEDKPRPNSGMTTGNTILEDDENIGINGLTDAQEVLYGLNPEVDNYSYEQASREYRQANGTEENKDYFYPNTEDINNNNRLDLFNDYFTYEIDLEDSLWFVTETKFSSGEGTGWKLYRIPLNDYIDKTNNPSLTEIQTFRMIFTGCDDQDTVHIAGVGLVGNEWQEIGVAQDSSENYILDDNMFKISVINTEDNPEYDSPRGVMGKLDPVYNIRAKEQSLALNVQDLPSGYRTAAKKSLINAENYMNYKAIKMFVHGDYNDIGRDVPIQFYLRMGNISGTTLNDYYEVTTPVYPGWDERNYIDVVFEEITSLKQLVEGDGVTTFVSDDGTIREKYFLDEEGGFTGRKYKVVGNPSFSRVNFFIIGVLNTGEDDYTGEIWVNELRVSDPLREKGIAFRGNADLDLAGITTISVAGNYKEASFHEVNQQYSTSGPTSSTDALTDNRSVNVVVKFNTHKLLPKKWSLNMPVSVVYSDQKNTPTYAPGSDIRLTEVPDSIITQSNKIGISTSFKKSSKSDFWLTKYTLDRLGGNFSTERTSRSDKTILENSSAIYKGGITYGLTFPKNDGISYLKWVPFYGPKLVDKKFYYLPSSMNYSVNMGEENRYNQPRIGSATQTYRLSMDQSFSFGYNPLDNMQASYKRSSNHNLDSLRYRKTDILTEFDTGFKTRESENYSLNFTPKITSFFAPKLSYSSGFGVTHKLDVPYSTTTNKRNLGASFDIDPSKILEAAFGKGKKDEKQGSSGSPKPKPRPKPGAKDDEKKDEKKDEKGLSVSGLLSAGIRKIQPFNISITETRDLNNVGVILGDSSSYYRQPVDLLYRMGFRDSPSDSIDASVVGNNTINTKRGLSIRTGYKFTNNLNSTFNYKYDHTENLNGDNVNITTSRGFLPLGETGSDGIPMVNWSLKWSGLNKIKYIEDYVKNLSLEHGFNGSETVKEQNGELQNFTYQLNFSPLLGIAMLFNNGIRADLRYTTSEDIVNQNTDTRKVFTENGSFMINYSRKGGIHIPLPFMKDLNMENQIDLSMNVTYSKRDVYLRKIEGGDFDNTEWNTSWKLRPVMDYQFSKNISGSVFYEYGETSTPTNPLKITRDFGLTVKIRISG